MQDRCANCHGAKADHPYAPPFMGPAGVDAAYVRPDQRAVRALRRRNPVGRGLDSTGWLVDREEYGRTTETVALLRYVLEPQGVRMDQWSMSEGPRSRTYTFGDLFDGYAGALRKVLPRYEDGDWERLNREAWQAGS